MRILLAGSTLAPAAELEESLSTEFELTSTTPAELILSADCKGAASYDAVLLDAEGIPAAERHRLLTNALQCLLEVSPQTRVVTIIPSHDSETARIAVAAGSWDVVTMDTGASEIAKRLRVAGSLRRLEAEAHPEPPLLGRIDFRPDPIPEPAPHPPLAKADEPVRLLGKSEPMQALLSTIRRVARVDVPVLLTGESGTGKELAARMIHERSPRCSGPFVPVNSGAIPADLMESELFGHARGSFTGASRDRTGRCEAAGGGTLFLDEVGELPLALQAKLLRFLEDHVVEPVGTTQRIPVDVRVVAATNRDLEAAVEAGEFREDLYYRLAVFCLELAPLRDREDDVMLLARAFLEREAGVERPLDFSSESVAALLRSPWEGNVRELLNRVRRAVVAAEGPLITPEDLGFNGLAAPPQTQTLRTARVEAEIACIRNAIARTAGNRSEAARALGISRTQLYDLINRHHIE